MTDTHPRVGIMMAEKLGSRLAVMRNTRWRDPQVMTPDPAYASEHLGRSVRPGSSFHGPAHDVVKLYSMLLTPNGGWRYRWSSTACRANPRTTEG
jgi:hypothetical protein